MEVQEALTMRKSTRAFTEQKVDRSLIRTIIKRAGMAPSGVNTQPWEVAIVSGKTRARLVSTVEQAFRDGISGKMDYQYYPLSGRVSLKSGDRILSVRFWDIPMTRY